MRSTVRRSSGCVCEGVIMNEEYRKEVIRVCEGVIMNEEYSMEVIRVCMCVCGGG